MSFSTQAVFVVTTMATLYFLYMASKSWKLLVVIISWMVLTAILSLTGFYSDFEAFPPRFLFLLTPGVLAVIILTSTAKGRKFFRSWDVKWLTFLHVVRIPVEIVLFAVYTTGLIPEIMTFSGYNYDIISGISAPIIYYLVFVKKSLGYKALFIWNMVCLALLVNIVAIAVLSAPTPFQQLALDQPNVGVTYFPLVWLPAVVVPVVLLAHLVSVLKLKDGQI